VGGDDRIGKLVRGDDEVIRRVLDEAVIEEQRRFATRCRD
jgi:hypothetical protein